MASAPAAKFARSCPTLPSSSTPSSLPLHWRPTRAAPASTPWCTKPMPPNSSPPSAPLSATADPPPASPRLLLPPAPCPPDEDFHVSRGHESRLWLLLIRRFRRQREFHAALVIHAHGLLQIHARHRNAIFDLIRRDVAQLIVFEPVRRHAKHQIVRGRNFRHDVLIFLRACRVRLVCCLRCRRARLRVRHIHLIREVLQTQPRICFRRIPWRLGRRLRRRIKPAIPPAQPAPAPSVRPERLKLRKSQRRERARLHDSVEKALRPEIENRKPKRSKEKWRTERESEEEKPVIEVEISVAKSESKTAIGIIWKQGCATKCGGGVDIKKKGAPSRDMPVNTL